MAACCSSIGSATTLVAKIVGSSAMTDTASSSRSISSTTSSEAAAPASTATCISRGSKPGRVNRTMYSAAGSMSKTKRPSSPVTCSRAAGSGPPVTATLTPGRAPPPTSATEPSIAIRSSAPALRGAGSSAVAARNPADQGGGLCENGASGVVIEDLLGHQAFAKPVAGPGHTSSALPWRRCFAAKVARRWTGDRATAAACGLPSGPVRHASVRGSRPGDYLPGADFAGHFAASAAFVDGIPNLRQGVTRRKSTVAGTCRRADGEADRTEVTFQQRRSGATAQYRNRYDSFVKNARLVCRRAVVGNRTASNRSPC